MADQEKQQKEFYENLQHKKRAFLVAYSECGNVTKAAEASGISRQSHYDWLATDPEYAEAFRHADDAAGDRLEAEARRRAVEGVDEPVYHKGEVVGYIRKYSDTLLIFLLKGAKPDKYAERSKAQITGTMTIEQILDDLDD